MSEESVRKFGSSEPVVMDVQIPSVAAIPEEAITDVRVLIRRRNVATGPAVRNDVLPAANWELAGENRIRVQWRDGLEGQDPLPVGLYDAEVWVHHGAAGTPPRKTPHEGRVQIRVEPAIEE